MRRLRLLSGVLLLTLAASACAQQNLAEQYLLGAANQERQTRGLPPLRLDAALTQAARQHALVMAAHRGISHQFSGEPELSRRGFAAGAHFSRITENVAEAPSTLILHTAWMHSPGHRDNLLDAQVDAAGIAVVVGDRQLYAVEDFARITPSLSLAQQETTTALLLDQAGLKLVPGNAEARSACASPMQGSSRPVFTFRYTASSLDALPEKLTHRLVTGEFHSAAVGACMDEDTGPFAAYRLAILLYR